MTTIETTFPYLYAPSYHELQIKTDARIDWRGACFVPEHDSLPPSYGDEESLPSYEDVYNDVPPPEYTGTARAPIIINGSNTKTMSVANDALLHSQPLDISNLLATMDLDALRKLRVSEIDWSKVDARECVSKKKKQEQKKAQQVIS